MFFLLLLFSMYAAQSMSRFFAGVIMLHFLPIESDMHEVYLVLAKCTKPYWALRLFTTSPTTKTNTPAL